MVFGFGTSVVRTMLGAVPGGVYGSTGERSRVLLSASSSAPRSALVPLAPRFDALGSIGDLGGGENVKLPSVGVRFVEPKTSDAFVKGVAGIWRGGGVAARETAGTERAPTGESRSLLCGCRIRFDQILLGFSRGEGEVRAVGSCSGAGVGWERVRRSSGAWGSGGSGDGEGGSIVGDVIEAATTRLSTLYWLWLVDERNRESASRNLRAMAPRAHSASHTPDAARRAKSDSGRPG